MENFFKVSATDPGVWLKTNVGIQFYHWECHEILYKVKASVLVKNNERKIGGHHSFKKFVWQIPIAC